MHNEFRCHIPGCQNGATLCLTRIIYTSSFDSVIHDVVDLCTQFGKAHCVSVLYEEHKATLNDELTQLPTKASYLYKVNIIVKECVWVRKNSPHPGFQEKLDAFFAKSFSDCESGRDNLFVL